ncbi:microfibrillar-associated protein 4 precursor [Esox lucius]|uniref:Microfibril-associated glycoprotein 4 n=1 Tax=Esox lucius TaxID=8010 RepID=C1BWS4_ESOLU|nr:microfibrillar-associated protein 4 precursor [Esox lucius]ACO13477.1 Microfibril-associated glycoprotein 4 precursor [Esox lucius]
MTFRLLLPLLIPVMVQCSLDPVDCSQVYASGHGQNGVYTIYPAGPTSPVQVFCDMSMDNGEYQGKWTVIQRRRDGSVNFHRKWEEYKRGFGSAAGEYWLGLETMHLLTKARKYELRVDMEDFEGRKVFAQYSSFSVAPESEGYPLTLGSFTDGGAGDSLTHHSGQKFTTLDKDQDLNEGNCGKIYYGGFWYNNCHWTNPNGIYAWGESAYGVGINWRTWKGFTYSLKTMTMKIRPATA